MRAWRERDEIRAVGVRAEPDEISGTALRTFHAMTHSRSHDSLPMVATITDYLLKLSTQTDINTFGRDVFGLLLPKSMLVRKRLESEVAPHIISILRLIGSTQCWTGKYVRGRGFRVIRASTANSTSECSEAACIADLSVQRQPRRRRTAVTFRQRLQQRKLDFARACDVGRRAVLARRRGRELRRPFRVRCD